MAPADSVAKSAWNAAVARYSRPGVREACLRLQDDYGVDVPTLLTATWAATELGVDDPGVAVAMHRETARWSRGVVSAIRSARRSAARAHTATPLVDDLRAAELSAERELIERLAAVAQRLASPDAPRGDDASRVERVLAGWLAHLLHDPQAARLLGAATGMRVATAHPARTPDRTRFGVSALQVASPTGEPRVERVERVLAAVQREASQHHPDLIVLPELWTTGFFHFGNYSDDAEPLHGATVSALAALAGRTETWLCAGSFIERGIDGALSNTSVCLSPHGAIAGVYRKMHLFGFESDEARLLTAGEEAPVVRTPFGALAMTTCYDLRFPELYRDLLDAGAEVVVVSSAWPAARRDHWDLFTRARAVENLGVLIACNASGEQAGSQLGGHSVVVSPWGAVIAEVGDDEAWMRATVDLDEVAERRRTFPAVADRRR